MAHHRLLNHWAQFNRTCYITSPHNKGVRKQYCFPCVRRLSICLTRYLLLTARRNSTKPVTSIPLMVMVCKSNISCVRRLSVCPSRYLLNHCAELTKLPTSLPFMVGVRKSNIIFTCVSPSVRPSSVYLSVTLSPPKTLGGIQ